MEFDPGRRRFMKTGFDRVMDATMLATIGFTGGPIAWRKWWETVGKNETQERIDRTRRHIRERYGVEAVVSFDPGEHQSLDTEGFEIQMWEVRSIWLQVKILERIAEILSVYPPSAVRGRLKNIYVVHDFSNLDVEGFDNAEGRSGIEEGRGSVVIEAPEDLFSTHLAMLGGAVSRFTTHHEIAHTILDEITEEEWLALMPGENPYTMFWMLEEDGAVPDGFVSRYGLRSYLEDIATTAEVMFSRRPDPDLLEDKIVQRKIAFLRERYAQVSGGRMNDQYWDDVRHGRVNEEYWDQRNPQP